MVFFRYGKKRRSYDDPTTEASGLKLLATTLSLLKKRRQLLMLPITMFIGLEQSFLAVDFTKVKYKFYFFILN